MLYIEKDSDSFLKKIFQIFWYTIQFTVFMYILCFWVTIATSGTNKYFTLELTTNQNISLFNKSLYIFFWGAIFIYVCVLIYAAFKYKNITFFKVRTSYFVIILTWFMWSLLLIMFVGSVRIGLLKNFESINKVIEILIVTGAIVLAIKSIYGAVKYRMEIRDYYKRGLDEGDRILDLYYSQVKEKKIPSAEEIYSEGYKGLDPDSAIERSTATDSIASYLIIPTPKTIRLYVVLYYVGSRDFMNRVYGINKEKSKEFDKIKKEKLERKLLKRRRTLINSLEPRKKKSFF